MDNPARTAEYLARLERWRTELRAKLAEILPAQARLVWEIGCGHGHFLTAYARAHPDEICVGVDISGERIVRAQRKRDRAQLSNLHFIQAEASMFLEALPPDAGFAAVYILFPDPWPKQRHHKNRILQPDFLTAVARRAGQGVRLHFRTDYEPYFRDSELIIAGHCNWHIIAEPWPFEQLTVFQSRAAQHHSLIAQRRPRDA